MASATSTPLSLSPPPSAQVRKQGATLSPVTSLHQTSRLSNASAYCRKMARNVVAMTSTKEALPATATATSEVETTTELPEFVKTLQDTWEKVEDKYAITSLAVAVAVGLVAFNGMISAIDRLPLVPGVFEIVGIGYTGWFAYKNLINKPEREALFQKIKDTYKDIIS